MFASATFCNLRSGFLSLLCCTFLLFLEFVSHNSTRQLLVPVSTCERNPVDPLTLEDKKTVAYFLAVLSKYNDTVLKNMIIKFVSADVGTKAKRCCELTRRFRLPAIYES
ncbi:hypothetical protein K438DRAFT_1775189 [Mycena galopus ATCC 62051]|nr:hypothetical protein K438DRAFT_1775189 [Mycena galopus ATCC 62051]